MKITKIKIRNILGVSEAELDGRSVELQGGNGTGKTSIIDAIRLALTNTVKRDVVIKKGATEGEVLIETNSGLSILRKKRAEQSDYKRIAEGNKVVASPEKYLSDLFTTLQLDPVEFTRMTPKEQNRAILNLIHFDWDLKWIEEKFGEIPKGVNYDQHILAVLSEIQAENGYYYQSRQNLNRDIRNKRDAVAEIAKTIPENYQSDMWRKFPFSEKYAELNRIKDENSKTERAKAFASAYTSRLAAAKATRDEAVQLEKDLIADERGELQRKIERLRAEIKAAEDKITGLDGRLADKVKIADAEYNAAIAKINSDNKLAQEYAGKQITPTEELEAELSHAQSMQRHINEYDRMRNMQAEIEAWQEKSEQITEKIELARSLPGEILQKAKLPLAGLTVENGIPLINGLPVSNLSEGEQLDLCVDVALSKPGGLQIILIDGIEKLSAQNRERMYEKCRENGLQFIATRTTDADELEVVYL